MKETWDAWWRRIVGGAVGAALLAGGTTIIDNRVTNARQDEKLAELSDLDDKIDELNIKLSKASVQIAIFNDRWETLRAEGLVAPKREGPDEPID